MRKGKYDMKLTRRITTLLLALIMVLSVSATVFAEGETYTITVTGTSEGHTFEAYQIFTGDLNEEGKLSNVVWGSGVTTAGQTALGDAAVKAASLTDVAAAEAFAEEVSTYLTAPSASATVGEGATTCALADLAPGYYLIRTTAVPTTNGVYTEYLMHVVYVNADMRIKVKASVPSFEKESDKTVVSVDDTVTFTLTSSLPTNLAAYETYTMTFHDQLPAESLEFVAITSVTIGTKTLTADTDYTVANNAGALTISIPNVLSVVTKDAAGSEVKVVYTTKVLTSATIGEEGFENKAKVEYSNNPYDNSTGTSPEKTVKLVTWSIPVFKYTGSENDKSPLPGAGFTLYKDEACTQAITVTKEANSNLYRVDPNSTTEEIVTDSTGKFTIGGLGAGTYYLKETATPSGYNTADVVAVTISSTGVLTIPAEVSTVLDPPAQPTTQTVTEVAILNQPGSTLPSTGGTGTTMIYIVGGILVLAAVVLLVTKRRMSTAE